jgi:hypothetical protein
MAAHIVFCSATDRNVILVPRTSETLWRIVVAADPEMEVECLSLGVSCTGSMCPFAADRPSLSDPLPGATV